MMTFKNIIKYIFLFLGISLSVLIIYAGFTGIYSLGKLIGQNTFDKNDSTSLNENYRINEQIESLDINLDYSNLNILIASDDSYFIKKDSEDITCEIKDKKLIVSDSYNNLFVNKDNELTIMIPKKDLKNVKIKMGAGKTNIEYLSSESVELNLGAGLSEIKNITVSGSINIKTGAGKFTMSKANLNNLKFDMGVGKTEISGLIFGQSEINCGIGKTDIDLENSLEDYTFEVKKGIGSIMVDQKSIENDASIGNGNNKIKLSGGVGKITVNFLNTR